jgi:hypothetical protein
LTVTAQHIDGATRQAAPELNVWPLPRTGEPFFDWRPASQGWREFPLTVPAPVQPGRMILRYEVRSHGGRTPAPAAVNAVVVDFLSRARE